jgi:hypothetical protein
MATTIQIGDVVFEDVFAPTSTESLSRSFEPQLTCTVDLESTPTDMFADYLGLSTLTLRFPSSVPRHNAPKKRKKRLRKKIDKAGSTETHTANVSGVSPAIDNTTATITFELKEN